MEKNLERNYTRMLRAILNKAWRQQSTKLQLYSHLPPISKTIKDESEMWDTAGVGTNSKVTYSCEPPSHGRAKARRPARTCIEEFCVDTGCSLEDLPNAMNHREKWRERIREIRVWCDLMMINCHNEFVNCVKVSRFRASAKGSVIYLYNIIIIMSRRQRRYPWPSLAISPYHSSPPAGLQGYILCPHIVAVCKFVLVVLLLHIHMWGSTGVHRLWARPCFSSSVLRVWFVWLV